jgi:hypothetical protein
MTANDVYTYSPEDHHCIEGLAIENERGDLIDWFWGGSAVSHRQHVSRDAAGLTLIANLGDYDLTPRGGRSGNQDYAPEDRLMIHSQHGLQRVHYVRKGAKPDLSTKIENARKRLEDAEAELRSAQHRVEWAQTVLAGLEAEES